MIHCNRCDYENEDTSTYCVRCGTQLDSGLSGLYEFVSSAPFPPHAKEGTNAQPDFGTFPPPFAKETVRPNVTGKKVLNIVIAAIIFCIGAFASSFGLMGSLFSLMDSSPAVLLGFGLFLASFIVFAIVITQHNVFYLRWWLKLLLLLPATGVYVIAVIAVSILLLNNNNALSNIMYGGCFLLYGIVLEVIALWPIRPADEIYNAKPQKRR
jgi:hypothetical protein